MAQRAYLETKRTLQTILRVDRSDLKIIHTTTEDIIYAFRCDDRFADVQRLKKVAPNVIVDTHPQHHMIKLTEPLRKDEIKKTIGSY